MAPAPKNELLLVGKRELELINLVESRKVAEAFVAGLMEGDGATACDRRPIDGLPDREQIVAGGNLELRNHCLHTGLQLPILFAGGAYPDSLLSGLDVDTTGQVSAEHLVLVPTEESDR